MIILIHWELVVISLLISNKGAFARNIQSVLSFANIVVRIQVLDRHKTKMSAFA